MVAGGRWLRALAVSVVSWRLASGAQGHCAVRGGVLSVAGGNRVENTQNVRHCENAEHGTPQYWDVTYDYRGVTHHVQMSSPPGRTILVNRDGEPRV